MLIFDIFVMPKKLKKMVIKNLVEKLKKARTPKKFYDAAQELLDAATSFLDDNSYSSRDANGIEVDVKVYSRLENFEDALERLAEKYNLSEDAKEYITDELGENWANEMYDSWLDFERENIMLYLEDFTNVINEKEVGFAGRSGGHLILGDDEQYRKHIEEIEYIIDNNFNKQGEYIGDEKFAHFLNEDDGVDLIHWAETLTDLDVFSAAIDKIKNAVKGIPDSWKDELDYRLNEWYENDFSEDDVKRFVEKRDYEENKKNQAARQAEENPPFPKDKFIYISTTNNEYYVNYLGLVSQKKIVNKPYYAFTGNWKLTGIVRHDDELGDTIRIASFNELTPERISKLNESFANGDYHVTDIDYGTSRMWGAKLTSMMLVDDPRDKSIMRDGGDVIQKDTSLFGTFMEIRFPHVTTDDSYYRTWVNRWNKGIDLLWNEADDTTRSAIIEAIEKKAKNKYYFKEVPLEYKDASLPVSYLFVKNRFGRDLNDSYAQTWISRLGSPIEKAIGQMDNQSMGVLVSALKFKKQNP